MLVDEGMKTLCCVAVSAMAERLANHFACYRPASDLFLQLLDMDKLEDAKFMLAVSPRSLCPASVSDSDTSNTPDHMTTQPWSCDQSRGQMSSVSDFTQILDSFRKDVKSEQSSKQNNLRTSSEPPQNSLTGLFFTFSGHF